MKQLRNFILLGLFSLFLLSACRGEPSNLADVTLESVFPADSSLVFVLDYSNGDQVEAFRELKERFPETDLFEKFRTLVAAEGETKLSYEDDVEPFLGGEWRVGIGVTLPEEINFEDADSDPFEAFGIYIVAELEESDAFEDFVNLAMEDSYDAEDFDYKENGEIKYWSSDVDLLYIARYGDVFVLTNSSQSREDAIERIEDGSGFQSNEKIAQAVTTLAPENLGYVYFNGEVFSDFMAEFYTAMGMGDLVQYFEGMGDIYGTWFADDDGIMMLSQSKVTDAAFLKNFFGDTDYKLSLIDFVNGDGLIAYSESANFGPYLKSFLEGFAAGYNSVDSGFGAPFDYGVLPTDAETEDGSNFDAGVLETNILGPLDVTDGESFYQTLLEELASLGDMTTDDVEAILNSPFAFAMSDIGGYIPTFAFYVDVDSAQSDNAKQLTSALDVYMDKIIGEFDTLMAGLGGSDVGLLKKDIEVVNGGGLHKLYIDWEAASPETLSALAMATLSPEDLKLELYYGVTGDDVFVIAFYPDFYKDYGKNVVSEKDDFTEGFEKIAGEDTLYISYFNLRPLIDIVGRYLQIAHSFGFLLDEDMRNFDLYGRQFAGTLRYFIGSTVYSEEDIMSKVYVRFEEVEE